MSAAGARTFARYAFPPNELGYCGPAGAQEMLVPGAVAEIERRARLFDGAWVYLEFLAEALDTGDPLASEVVEAYWVGSDLLDAIDPGSLHARLVHRFATQRGGTWRDAQTRASPHHAFQVFEVYPWAAMLRSGLPPAPAVSVLDRCRIRTGVVQEVDGDWVSLSDRPLAWNDGRLMPGEAAPARARWSIHGLSLMDAPQAGDLVALHWDWVCDVITGAQADQIERREARQREAVGLG